MGRSKFLDKRARDIILDRMREQGEMTVEEAMDMIRPHYDFDAQEAREQGIRRQANRMMRSLRDKSGVRTCFAHRQDSTYVNIEKCKDNNRVAQIEHQLQQQLDGVRASRNKARRRRQALEGQLSFDAAQSHVS